MVNPGNLPDEEFSERTLLVAPNGRKVMVFVRKGRAPAHWLDYFSIRERLCWFAVKTLFRSYFRLYSS